MIVKMFNHCLAGCVTFVFLLQVCLLFGQYRTFVMPLQGSYGNDYAIVNYVDWSFSTYQDAYCGTKTYDGHQGTDFTLHGFEQMDSGVNVLAVDSGTVTFIHDGEFDRETSGDTSLHLGNFICIRHAGNYYSYYGHLKNGSLLVSPGQHVAQGQAIARVGSSGNSTDPHLHFELWYDSLYLVDPFSGLCGNDSTFWITAPLYDTTFTVWRSGISDTMLSLNYLRFTKEQKSLFNNCVPANHYISYWNLLRGLQLNDSTRTQWLKPDGSVWYEYSYTNALRDYWYYYHWSYIDINFILPETGTGWKVNFFVNGVLRDSRSFDVNVCTSIDEQQQEQQLYFCSNNLLHFTTAVEAVGVIAMDGTVVCKSTEVMKDETLSLKHLPPGIYVVSTEKDDVFVNAKVVLY